MPSPFPGMDPYLENPAIWGSIHTNLISVIQEFLAGPLEPNYYILSQERVYISDPLDPGRRVIAPDVFVSQRASAPQLLAIASSPRVITSPTQQVTLLDEEIRTPYLVIYDKLNHQVVTIIELLSPANKVAGARGRAEFLRKRTEVWASDTHWLEIDLLRAGQRDPWAAGRSDYCALRSRADQRDRVDLWLFNLPDPLPVLPVPLHSSDPDVPLLLAEVLQTVYNRGRYHNIVDYDQPPTPALAEDEAAWAVKLLAQR